MVLLFLQLLVVVMEHQVLLVVQDILLAVEQVAIQWDHHLDHLEEQVVVVQAEKVVFQLLQVKLILEVVAVELQVDVDKQAALE